MKKQLFNKQAQIGQTITWFVGFVLIFFIIILFLSASIVNSGRKKVTTGWDEVKLAKYDSNLRSQKVLFDLLNTNFKLDNEERSLKFWLTQDIYNMGAGKKAELREKIREEVKKSMGSTGNTDCYIFQAYSGYSGKNPEDISKNVDPRGASYVGGFVEKNSIEFGSYDANNIDPRGQRYFGEAQTRLIKKSTSIILVRDTNKNVFGVEEDFQKVQVKFYIGGCY